MISVIGSEGYSNNITFTLKFVLKILNFSLPCYENDPGNSWVNFRHAIIWIVNRSSSLVRHATWTHNFWICTRPSNPILHDFISENRRNNKTTNSSYSLKIAWYPTRGKKFFRTKELFLPTVFSDLPLTLQLNEIPEDHWRHY